MRRATASAAKCWRTCGDGRETSETMSRIGKQPIELPSSVEVTVGQGNVVTVNGPRGSLTQVMHANMRNDVEDGSARVERPDGEGIHRRLHGLHRSLLGNLAVGE